MLKDSETARFAPREGASIEVVEVGPRDGLQIESEFIPTDAKIEIVNGLIDAGLRYIEVTSFVSPRAVPQLADAAEVIAGIDRSRKPYLTALVPNIKGTEKAVSAGIDGIIVACSASETHNRKNVNRSVAESLASFPDIVRVASDAGVDVVGGIGTSFGCPFEGDIDPHAVLRVAQHYADLGARQIALGDTTGMATPPIVRQVVRLIRQKFPELGIRLHFHNTRGVGLANVMVGLAEGVTMYDASVGGLGGCPFAVGATGNICTEDLVYLLHESGYQTGVDLRKLIAVAQRIQGILGRDLPGQVMKSGERLDLHPVALAKTATA